MLRSSLGRLSRGGSQLGVQRLSEAKYNENLKFSKITRRAEVFFSLKSNTNARKFSGQAFKRGFSAGGSGGYRYFKATKIKIFQNYV